MGPVLHADGYDDPGAVHPITSYGGYNLLQIIPLYLILGAGMRFASVLTHSYGTGWCSGLARMVSAGFVQLKGLGSSLCSAI